MRLVRPFPSRNWLKRSLETAQHELANARTDVKIMDAYRVRDAKRIEFLEAQVHTQAQTIADLDADIRSYAFKVASTDEELDRALEELSDSAALLHAIRKGEKLHPIVERFISTLWASRRHYQEMPPCGVPGHVRGSWEDDVARIWWCPDCGDEMRMLS